MGPTHAVSGVVGWLLAAPTVAAVTDRSMDRGEVMVGALVASGAAMIPDIDSLSSTVTRAFGWPSRILAVAVRAAAAWTYEATRTRHDPPAAGVRRTLTHTLVFSAAVALGVNLLCSAGGSAAAQGVLFVTCGLAVRGLLADWAARADWVIVSGVSAGVSWTAHHTLEAQSYWLLGVAVGVGCVVHLLGDMITRKACPLLWPLSIRGRRWRPIGPPRFVRIRAGGTFERWVLLPGLTILNAVLVWVAWGEDIAGYLI